MKDSELIQKVHSGNKEAVGIIIERYYADIYRFCLYMVQIVFDLIVQHYAALLACLWIALYTVISIQKEKGSRAPSVTSRVL